MLQTVEAEINIDGTITFLEPFSVKTKTRILITVLKTNETGTTDGSRILNFLQNNRLPAESRRNAAEIAAQIEENRNSWD